MVFEVAAETVAVDTDGTACRIHKSAYRSHQHCLAGAVYALMKDIAQMTDDRLNLGAGSLYGALDTLQKRGWIKALDEYPQDRKKEYIITDTGKKFFERDLVRLEEMLQNAKKVKEAANENYR